MQSKHSEYWDERQHTSKTVLGIYQERGMNKTNKKNPKEQKTHNKFQTSLFHRRIGNFQVQLSLPAMDALKRARIKDLNNKMVETLY